LRASQHGDGHSEAEEDQAARQLTRVDLGADELELDAPSDHVQERVEVARDRLLEVLLLLPPHGQRRPHRHLLRLLRAALVPGGRRRQPGQALADGRHDLPPLLQPASLVERREAELVRGPPAAWWRPRNRRPPEAGGELPAWRSHVALPLGNRACGSSDLRFWRRAGGTEA
jgi:hypothetical protein